MTTELREKLAELERLHWRARLTRKEEQNLEHRLKRAGEELEVAREILEGAQRKRAPKIPKAIARFVDPPLPIKGCKPLPGYWVVAWGDIFGAGVTEEEARKAFEARWQEEGQE